MSLLKLKKKHTQSKVKYTYVRTRVGLCFCFFFFGVMGMEEERILCLDAKISKNGSLSN